MAIMLAGSLTELARLTAATAGFCREHALPPDVESDLNLVLEELFVNTLEHGGCEGIPEAVQVALTAGPDAVALEYADRGVPFDPTHVPSADLAASLAERAEGGLGLHLVRQIMRDFEYHRVDGWNRLRMRRLLPVEAS